MNQNSYSYLFLLPGLQWALRKVRLSNTTIVSQKNKSTARTTNITTITTTTTRCTLTCACIFERTFTAFMFKSILFDLFILLFFFCFFFLVLHLALRYLLSISLFHTPTYRKTQTHMYTLHILHSSIATSNEAMRHQQLWTL